MKPSENELWRHQPAFESWHSLQGFGQVFFNLSEPQFPSLEIGVDNAYYTLSVMINNIMCTELLI